MAEAPKQQQQNQQIQIKADEKELLGQYSNLVVVHHNQEEFTLNFIYLFPTVPQGKLVGSIIINPRHAKRLMRALQENIARYEAQFGAIPEDPTPVAMPNVGFIQ
jgi:Protein of unknown function (DUF3467)